jgi:hypothetical protein
MSPSANNPSKCLRCSSAWTLRNVEHSALPMSSRDSTFPEFRYSYCNACGYTHTIKQEPRA